MFHVKHLRRVFAGKTFTHWEKYFTLAPEKYFTLDARTGSIG
ncbi:MAG: hypothetical protein ABSC63_06455 [Candidatus Binataceae bacterium]|jgi:hypothetical protein